MEERNTDINYKIDVAQFSYYSFAQRKTCQHMRTIKYEILRKVWRLDAIRYHYVRFEKREIEVWAFNLTWFILL